MSPTQGFCLCHHLLGVLLPPDFAHFVLIFYLKISTIPALQKGLLWKFHVNMSFLALPTEAPYCSYWIASKETHSFLFKLKSLISGR
jgi:hypothetical protein